MAEPFAVEIELVPAVAGGLVVLAGLAWLAVYAARTQRSRTQAENALAELERGETARRARAARAGEVRPRLARAARLATLGNLAAGFAHEINQPLSAIGNYVQAAIATLRSGSEAREEVLSDLEKISRQVDRASDIVQRLRDVASKGQSNKAELDLNDVVREGLELLEDEFARHRAHIAFDPAAGLPPVLADRLQLQTVVLNLIRNALEAAEPAMDEELRVEVRSRLVAQDRIEIVVADNGPGLPDVTEDELFSPFFSTEAEIPGFGLPTARSIVEAHGGRIRLLHGEGPGTAFAFTLPIAGEDRP